MLAFFIWRDVKVRYKQTVLGAAWAVLQPLATVLVFTLFLGRIPMVGGSMANYPLYVLAGIIPWIYFSSTFSAAANSVVANQNLVTKIYFPRLLLPLAVVGANFIDFTIAFIMLLIWMLVCGVGTGFTIVVLPLIVLLLMMASFGVGTLLAALIVSHRDFRFLVGFLERLGMYATPTIFLNMDTFSPRMREWLPLNPAYGLIDNFRRSILGESLDWYSLAISSVVSLLLLLFGCLYFRGVERGFADVI